MDVDPTLITHHFASMAEFLSRATAELVHDEYSKWIVVFESTRQRATGIADIEEQVAIAMDLTIDPDLNHITSLLVIKLIETRSNRRTREIFGELITSLAARIEGLINTDIELGWTEADFPSRYYSFFQLAISLRLALERNSEQPMSLRDNLQFVFALGRGDPSLLKEHFVTMSQIAAEVEIEVREITRSESERAQRRSAVVLTASLFISERGPLALHMRDLAQATNESVATLYRWFGSRSGLLAAVGRWLLEQMYVRTAELVIPHSTTTDFATRISTFSDLRWDYLSLVALHSPAEGFDLYASQRYRDIIRIANEIVGLTGVTENTFLSEILWITQCLLDVIPENEGVVASYPFITMMNSRLAD